MNNRLRFGLLTFIASCVALTLGCRFSAPANSTPASADRSQTTTEVLKGKTEKGAACMMEILEIRPDRISPAFVNEAGKNGILDYMLVKVTQSPEAIWLSPKVVLNENRSDSSFYWIADMSELSGRVIDDRLNGSIITGISDAYEVFYLPQEKIVKYTHYEYSEEDDSYPRRDLESYTCHIE